LAFGVGPNWAWLGILGLRAWAVLVLGMGLGLGVRLAGFAKLGRVEVVGARSRSRSPLYAFFAGAARRRLENAVASSPRQYRAGRNSAGIWSGGGSTEVAGVPWSWVGSRLTGALGPSGRGGARGYLSAPRDASRLTDTTSLDARSACSKGVGLEIVVGDYNGLSAHLNAIALSKRNYFPRPEFVGRTPPARFALAPSALDLVH
jgi:hypothetical protein